MCRLPAVHDQWQIYGKDRTFVYLAHNLQLTTQKFGKLHGDGEAQAGAAVHPGSRAVRLLKCLENCCQFAGRNTNTGVDHRNCHALLSVEIVSGKINISRRPAILNGNRTFLGEFYGVGDQILQDLVQPLEIGFDEFRQVRRFFQVKRQTFVLDHVIEVGHDPIN